jgi:hypothetical protein
MAIKGDGQMSGVSALMQVSLKKLFLIAVVTKVGSSFLAWLAGSPWLLGFVLPLTVMALYVVIGSMQRARGVSDESFGDICY